MTDHDDTTQPDSEQRSSHWSVCSAREREGLAGRLHGGWEPFSVTLDPDGQPRVWLRRRRRTRQAAVQVHVQPDPPDVQRLIREIRRTRR